MSGTRWIRFDISVHRPLKKKMYGDKMAGYDRVMQ